MNENIFNNYQVSGKDSSTSHPSKNKLAIPFTNSITFKLLIILTFMVTLIVLISGSLLIYHGQKSMEKSVL